MGSRDRTPERRQEQAATSGHSEGLLEQTVGGQRVEFSVCSISHDRSVVCAARSRPPRDWVLWRSLSSSDRPQRGCRHDTSGRYLASCSVMHADPASVVLIGWQFSKYRLSDDSSAENGSTTITKRCQEPSVVCNVRTYCRAGFVYRTDTKDRPSSDYRIVE